ncbi:hypothetical protein N865_11900 [Intrasporangium oryzae NRRL B-24470]|uniref:Uncharacterized protein n=1 Tax=Intrasporangium oryzae NRRL B-24470 TaxID=1386089 RepID=W9G4K4_9MICO|nr:hypothetical protein [Intrasporangium oryzae]EWT01046.1 hypothetical protein N865_11900 [Intrasporangium oryzae NRRL B-24470]
MDQSANTPEPDATDPRSTPTPAADDLDHHELEDEGPLPDLDPLSEARVRALLAAASDPGPMPGDVAARIEAALAEEARLRVDPAPTRAIDLDDAVLIPLIRRRQRPRPLLAVAAAAAAAAVVAVGASALHLTKRPNVAAALGDTTMTATSPTPTGSASLGDRGATIGTPGPVPSSLLPTGSVPVSPLPGPTNANLHIQVSATAYDAASLPTLARRLVSHPVPALPPLAAEAPHLGPVATETGLTSCLGALGVPTNQPVHADLAFFDGRPAVVIVSSSASGDTAYVVGRTCSTGDAHVLHPATPVP